MDLCLLVHGLCDVYSVSAGFSQPVNGICDGLGDCGHVCSIWILFVPRIGEHGQQGTVRVAVCGAGLFCRHQFCDFTFDECSIAHWWRSKVTFEHGDSSRFRRVNRILIVGVSAVVGLLDLTPRVLDLTLIVAFARFHFRRKAEPIIIVNSMCRDFGLVQC